MTEANKNTQLNGLTRAELIKILSDCLKICAERTTAERVKPGGAHETRAKYARCVAQLAAPLLSALKDEDIDELRAEIDELKQERGLGYD